MTATPKKKDFPSTKEAAPAPKADAGTNAKKRPIKVITVEDITVPIFAHEREVNGSVRVNYSWTVERSFKDSSGQWRRTSWFSPDEFGQVLEAVQKASEYVFGLQYPDRSRE